MSDARLQEIIQLMGRELAERQIILGRLNAIHTLLGGILLNLPAETAAKIGKFAEGSLAQQDADLIASPLAERTIAEHLRVLQEAIELLGRERQ